MSVCDSSSILFKLAVSVQERFACVKWLSHWVTRGWCFDSASKFHIDANGEIFDASPKNDRASPM